MFLAKINGKTAVKGRIAVAVWFICDKFEEREQVMIMAITHVTQDDCQKQL